jgi:hypothetical protein
LVRAYHWHQGVAGYYYRIQKRKGVTRRIQFHREVMGFPKGMQIDHINRVRSDNRRENLRIVTAKENMQNVPDLVGRSGVKNVHRVVNRGKVTYRAYDQQGKKSLGHFATPEEAAAAVRKHKSAKA